VAYRWRALRVRVMVGYVLRPSPDKGYVGAAIAAFGYSGASRSVVVSPRPPSGSVCGGSHFVARSRLGSPAPSAPQGLPENRDSRTRSKVGAGDAAKEGQHPAGRGNFVG